MLETFLNWIRQVLKNLIGKSDIKSKLNIDVAVSDKMSESIELWSAIYENRAPWLSDTVQSMNLGAAVASEVARMVTLEMKSEITGSPRADYLNEQYKVFLKHIRQYTEYGCAKGGIVFKPYVDGGSIAFDAVQADRFFPTAFSSAGKITGAVFVERIVKGSRYYTRLEHHELTDAGYHITNKAYMSLTESTLGNEVSLESVDEWASVEPEAVITGVDRPLFAYFKVAQANTADPSSPLGVSVYARATDLIKEADKQYSRLLWENEAGEMAVDVDAALLGPKDENGNYRIPKGKKRLYRTYAGIPDDTNVANGMKVFAPQLRDQSLINSLNELLMRIEDTCGLARGTFSNVQNDARTATELKIMRQRSYANVADNQKALQEAIEDYIYAMDVWATIGKLAPQGKYEASFEWDDSIIVDTESEQAIRLQEVASGLLKPTEYIKWRYGIKDDETARAMIPGMEQVTE